MSNTLQRSTVISLRLGAELYAQCKAIADKEEIPLSYVIRKAIRTGLKLDQKPQVKSTEVEMPDWE